MIRTPPKPHFLFIDCTRGYAVLLVITCHLTYAFPNLPYPLHRLTAAGWFGVQLFFLASSLTLLMSWTFEREARGSADLGAFFLRRFFRIAPAYYVAAVFYYVIDPPGSRFDAWEAVASALFMNTWHPGWNASVRTAWVLVPGGWSIGVEFTFYLLFPLFAAWVTTLSRAVIVFAASVAIGVIANRATLALLAGSYRPVEIHSFLYEWFPNQMSIFALGGVLFFVLREIRPGSAARAVLERYATLFTIAAVAAFCAFAYLPLGGYLGAKPYVPASLTFAGVLAGLIIALSAGGVFVNRYAAAMGRVSFSAYLYHFTVLLLFIKFPGTLHAHASGYEAIAAFAVGWVLTVLATYAVAWISYRAIEQPMIEVGKALIRARRARLDAALALPKTAD